MKARLKKDVVRLLLPLGISSVLLVMLLCGLARAMASEARVSFAAPARATNRPSSLDYQAGVSVCQQTQNLVPNPGFEQGGGGPWKPDAWYESGPCLFSYDDPGPNSDHSALIFAGSSGDTDCTLFTRIEEVPVEPGRFYDYSAMIRANLAQGDAYLRITFWSWNDDLPGWRYEGEARTASVTDTQGTWVHATGSVQAPAAAEYARVEAVLPSSSVGSVWFDDIFLGLAICLEISKRDDPDPVEPGQLLTYTIIYSNTGREKATNVQIIETYDPCVDLEWVQPPPLVGTTNTWEIPELPPGASGTITVVVRVVDDAEECAQVFNCVQIRSDETVDLIYTCISTFVVPDRCAIDLYLPDAGKPGVPGQPADYDLVLCNVGRCDGWAYLTATSSLDGDVVSVPSPPYSLPLDSCVQATVSISVPHDALSGTVDVTVITATLVCLSSCTETVTTTATLTTTVTSVPLTGVTIDGPTGGYFNTPYTFTATVTPATATLPIICAWSPTPALGQGCALVTYTWSTTGTKTISVTATNAGGTASDTHSFLVEWRQVYLPLVLRD
jgi:uncharacterized repeat protein (TIGR01451 family)